jgi:hypothetical protein
MRPFARRRLALALALALLALAVAFAVPPARTAILRFLHLGNVTVERVETLPPAEERPLLAGLGRSLPRAEAERRAGFRMLLPPLKGPPPERLNVLGRLLATTFTAPFDDGHERVLLVEMAGDEGLVLGKKVLEPGTRTDSVTVGGADALWIEGAPHVLMYLDRNGQVREATKRYAGNVLIWQRGPLTLRLEGDLTRAQALEIAALIEDEAALGR